MIIQVNYCLIDSKLCQLVAVVYKVRKEVELMAEIADELCIFWESEAREEYVLRIEGDICFVYSILEKICLTIKFIRDILMNFDRAELQVGEVINEI